MKYIRTKDNKIIDLSQFKNLPCLVNEYLDFTIYDFNRYGRFEAISQADTIEELCDEFIIQVNVHNIVLHDLISALNYVKDYKNHELTKDYIIYGAIWTSKGLIYIAKMNENGELKLL